MKHVIKYPAMPERFGDDGTLYTIVWDDEAGTVEGDHPIMEVLKIAITEGIGIWRPWGDIELNDVAHKPEEFLCVLTEPDEFWIDPRAILPDSLKGIEPLSPPYEPPPPGAIY